MGRRDAVAVILEINARMRQLEPRLRITFEPGWERRGNGLSANYIGGIVHHTASFSSMARPFPTQGLLRDGRSNLSGPLCNWGGPVCTVEEPWIHVTAAHPANHAGASGGRSMGPLPRTSLFNPLVVGLEIDYSGIAPMLDGQLYVGHLWSRATADVLAGGNLEYIRAHMETSVTGKFDPGYAPGRTYDMAEFRRKAAAITGRAPAPAPVLEDDDMFAIKTSDTNRIYIKDGYDLWHTGDPELAGAVSQVRAVPMNQRQVDVLRSDLARRRAEHLRSLVLGVAAEAPAPSESTGAAPAVIDVKTIATAVVDEMHRRTAD